MLFFLGETLDPPGGYDEVLSSRNNPLLNSYDEATNAEWSASFDMNYFGIHYNRGLASEELDAEQVS